MNAVYAVGHQIDDLVNGIGNACVPQSLGIVLEPLYHFGKLSGQAGTAHGDHTLDLFPVGHRHNAGFNGHVDTSTGCPIPEVVEGIVVEKQLGDEVACTGIDLFFQVTDVRVHVQYGEDGEKKKEIHVLKGLNFSIQRQEFVGIMGRSGCGKTTLLKLLGMIDRQTGGKLFFEEHDTEDLWKDEFADIRRRKIGFVFQDFYLMDSLSVRENIMLPKILDKKSAKECMEESQKYAEQFGITHLMNKKPYELSGGEKQRVAISRALINNPDLILADEPTGNLDSKSGDVVIHTLSHINRELGKTIVMVTHDPKMASYCSRLILLKDGMILEDMRNGGDQEAFYQEILGKMKEL